MKRIIPFIAALLASASVLAANPQLGFSELIQNQAQPHITINAADRSITNAVAGSIQLNFASDANLSLSSSQWQYATIILTDTGAVLTTGRDVIYPNVDAQTGGTSRMRFLVRNTTAQTLTIKRSGQSGVAISAGSMALVEHNGTDIEAISTGGGGGTVDLTTDVTGILPAANGGTGLASASDDTVMVSNGTAWQAKALTDCDDTGGNHVNYDTGTNAFSCGTSSGGGGSAAGSDTYVQYNSSGSLGAESAFTYTASSNTLTIGLAGGGGQAGNITIPEGTATQTGGNLNVKAGNGGSGTSNGGDLVIASGEQSGVGLAGDLYLKNGTNTTLLLESDGSWTINGSNGQNGQVITSNGSSSTPTWTYPAQPRVITAPGDVTVTFNDRMICVNKATGEATAVNLPGSIQDGWLLWVKDCKGDALLNNITVVGDVIDGTGTYVISTNRGAVGIVRANTEWQVVAVK